MGGGQERGSRLLSDALVEMNFGVDSNESLPPTSVAGDLLLQSLGLWQVHCDCIVDEDFDVHVYRVVYCGGSSYVGAQKLFRFPFQSI